MTEVSLYQAKNELSSLVNNLDHENVIILKRGKPVARLIPYDGGGVSRRPGAAKRFLSGFDKDEFDKLDEEVAADCSLRNIDAYVINSQRMPMAAEGQWR